MNFDKVVHRGASEAPAASGVLFLRLGLPKHGDIIVKQHGGSIEVDTQLGEFADMRVILQRVAALLPEPS